MKVCNVEGCDRPFLAKGYCSLHYYRLKNTGTLEPRYDFEIIIGDNESRFWSKVDKGSDSECWNWKVKSSVDGYGYFSVGKKKVLAHRYSYELANGKIPDIKEYHGTVIRHKCDNRKCVNPSHLIAGSQKDNVRDMDARGGRVSNPVSGSGHHMTYLTEDQVLAIYSDKGTRKETADKFCCSTSVVKDIRTGKTWSKVTGHLQ